MDDPEEDEPLLELDASDLTALPDPAEVCELATEALPLLLLLLVSLFEFTASDSAVCAVADGAVSTVLLLFILPLLLSEVLQVELVLLETVLALSPGC